MKHSSYSYAPHQHVTALADALQRSMPDAPYYHVAPRVLPEDNDWAASDFLVKLLLEATHVVPPLDRARTRALLEELDTSVSLESLESRFWVRFVLDRLELPAAISQELHRGKSEAISEPERAALRLLYDARHNKEHRLWVAEDKTKRLHSAHQKAHPRAPELAQLVEMEVLSPSTYGGAPGYDLPLRTHDTKNFWDRLSARVAALYWEDLRRNPEFADDRERVNAWLGLSGELSRWLESPQYLAAEQKQKLVEALFQRILDEPDLSDPANEIARVCLESDHGLRWQNDIPAFPGTAASLLERWKWWDHFRGMMNRQASRSKIDSLVGLVVHYDDGKGHHKYGKLFSASGNRPYLVYHLALGLRFGGRRALAALLTDVTTISLATRILNDLTLVDSPVIVDEDSTSRQRRAEVQKTNLWRAALPILVGTFLAPPKDAESSECVRAMGEVLLVLSEATFAQKGQDEFAATQRWAAEERLTLLLDELGPMLSNALSERALPLFEFICGRAMERYRDRPSYESMPVAEFKLLFWLLRTADPDKKIGVDREKIATAILSIYREELLRAMASDHSHIVHWHDDAPDAASLPWCEVALVLHERGCIRDLLEPSQIDFDALLRSVPLVARLAAGRTTQSARALGRAWIRKARLHLRILLRIHQDVASPDFDLELTDDPNSRSSVAREVEARVHALLSSCAAGDDVSHRPALFEPDYEMVIDDRRPLPDLVDKLIEALNRFSEAGWKVFDAWVERESEPIVLLTIISSAASQAARTKAKERLRSLDMDAHLARVWPSTLQQLAEAANHAGCTDIARQVVEHGKSNARVSSQAGWIDFAYRTNLAIAYHDNDLEALKALPIPAHDREGVQFDERARAEDDSREFFRGLLLIKEQPDESYKIFSSLLERRPNSAADAINRFSAALRVAQKIEDAGERRQAGVRALREWQTFEAENPVRNYEDKWINVAYNRLLSFDVGERHDAFDAEWALLKPEHKVQIDFVSLAVANARRRGYVSRAKDILQAARRFHLESSGRPSEPFERLEQELSNDKSMVVKVERLPAGTTRTNVGTVEEESPSDDRLIVLSVASEWASGHGGLSTLNRELCVAWAKARPRHRILCLVPSKPSEREMDDARARRVEIVVASDVPGLSGDARLTSRPTLPDGVSPDIILGHGHITGPIAFAHQNQTFQGSRRIHFLHVASEEIEPFKDQSPGRSASQKGEERFQEEVQRATSANLAVAVGPRLMRAFATAFHGGLHGKRAMCELLPGLPEIAQSLGPPPALQCLVLGRAEDYSLKGLDIAARALASVDHSKVEAGAGPPILVVRGAPSGEGDGLRKKLEDAAAKPGTRVVVREYSHDETLITNNLRECSVVLMPSRSEGFGLVGLEAIAASVPVLISNQSGLGEVILQHCPTIARHHVVTVTGDLDTDAKEWGRAIERTLQDRTAAFERATKLRAELRALLSWEKAVAEILGRLGL